MSSTRRVDLRLDGTMRFVARTGSGHDVVVDANAGIGGDDTAASPVELMLVAGGSCMAMDAVSILRKMRQDVGGYEVHVEGERAAEHPKVFTAIHMTHALHGEGLRAVNVARALQLSMTRYCPVFAMLSPTVAIDVRYAVTDDTTGARAEGIAMPEGAEAALDGA
jgi:putative redox protein